MSTIICPICYSETSLGDSRICESCGSLIPSGAEVRAEAARHRMEREPRTEPQARPHATEVELLQAFVAQFTENELLVPQGWRERLQALARETEPSRRYATIIFVDLRGYTRLSNILSESRLKELRSWFNTLCSTAVEKYGGFLIQLLGDAAFAAFGAPWAFERDAEAAIRCLLEIRERIREKGEFDGETIAIRAGAANGIINVDIVEEGGRPRPDLIGPPVNLAARLEARAETWEILIPEELANQVDNVFELEKREPFLPKNYGREIDTYAVIEEIKTPPVRRRTDIKFIGREEEKRQLIEFLKRIQAGEFGVVSIVGEAGIGKTRLVQQALQEAGLEIEHYMVALEPHQRHVMLYPWVQWLSNIADRGLSPSQEVAPARKIESIAGRIGIEEVSVKNAIGFLLRDPQSSEALASLPPAALRSAIEVSLLETVKLVGQRERCVLILDDLQWCDTMSLDLLARIQREQPEGVGIIAVGRPPAERPSGDYARAEDDSIRLIEEWPQIKLSGLSPEDATELLANVLDFQQAHPLLRKRLLEITSGQPLYLVELAETLSAEDPVSSSNLIRELVEGQTLESPSRLIEIFQARLDRLTHQQRLILQCGAILGRRFLESLLAGYDEIRERLIDELAVLKGVRLLHDHMLPKDREYIFTPPALRDIAYQMLPEKHRRNLHRAFAQVIEEKFVTRHGDFALELAHHWLRAGELENARPYFRMACKQANQFGAPHEAYAIAQRAIQISNGEGETDRETPAPRDEIARQQLGLIHEDAGRAARAMGDYETSLEHFRQWNAIAQEVGNAIWEKLSLHQQAVTLFELGRLAESAEMLRGLLQGDVLPEVQRLRIRQSLANLAYREGEYQHAIDEYLQVAEEEEVVGPGLVGDCRCSAALCFQRLGSLPEAAAQLEEGMRAYRRSGSPFGECVALNNLGILQEKMGDFEAAEETYIKTARKAEDCGYIHVLSAVYANLGNLCYLEGEYEEAERHSARALHYAQIIRHGNSEIIARINLALAFEGRRLLENAAQEIHRAINLAEATSDQDSLMEARLEAAWIAIKLGEIDEASRLLDFSSAGLAKSLRSHWHTLQRLLVTLQKGRLTDSLRLETIAKERATLSKTAFLRRCDSVLFLAEKGLADADERAIRDLRQSV